jgi:PAS domain S-box-containing protein
MTDGVFHPKASAPTKKFKNAADCLQQHRTAIIESWVKKTREDLPAAKNKSRATLLDSVTQILDEIISSLERGTLNQPSVTKYSALHAMHRATLDDYDLNQVLVEYRILRAMIFEVLDPEVEVNAAERNIILDIIHAGIASAAEQYSQTMFSKTAEYSTKLRQTEERLRLAVACANVGVFDHNRISGEIFWSDRMIELWAYSPDEFTGRIELFWDRIPPEDRVQVETAIQKSLYNRKAFEVVHRVIWPDCSVHWISSKGQASFDEKGVLTHVAGVAIDVTETVESERKLKMSEDLFRLASRATQDLIWDWDILRNKIRWNEALSIQYGYPSQMQETSLEWWAEHVHPDDAEQAKQSVITSIKQDASRWREHYRFKDQKGNYRFIIDRGFIVRDERGHAIRMVGAMQDVTTEMRVQENLRVTTVALEQSESRFRAFFDNASVGLAEVDPFTRKYIRVNPKFCKMLGYTSEELSQKYTSDVTHPDDNPEDARLASKLIQGEIDEIRREKRYLRKDGKILWVEINISAIRDSQGRPRFNITVVLDITQRKEAQEDLFRALQQLQEERAVRERFVSALTHDLRTPLSAAKMSAELSLQNAQVPDRVSLLSSKTIHALDRVDRMIQDLLDVSQINAGAPLSIKPISCNISQLIHDVCEELTVAYNARFQIDVPTDATGYWSCAELRRAIENLGSNAAKYGDLSRPITVKLSYVGSSVELSVHNFGQAIPVEEQAHIFDSFLRSCTSKTKSKGWGLGLSLVKGVAEAHHGSVRVESTVEKGTTFTMTLPIDFRITGQAARRAAG